MEPVTLHSSSTSPSSLYFEVNYEFPLVLNVIQALVSKAMIE